VFVTLTYKHTPLKYWIQPSANIKEFHTSSLWNQTWHIIISTDLETERERMLTTFEIESSHMPLKKYIILISL